MRFFTPNVMIVVVTSKSWQRGRKHIKIIPLLCALNLYWYLFLAHTRRQSGKRVELSVYCGKFVIRPLAKSMCSFHTRSLKLIIIGDSIQRIHTNDSEHGPLVLYSYKAGTHETDNTPNRWRKTVCSLDDESNKKMNTDEKTLTQKCLAMRFGYDSSVLTVSTSWHRNFLHDFFFFVFLARGQVATKWSRRLFSRNSTFARNRCRFPHFIYSKHVISAFFCSRCQLGPLFILIHGRRARCKNWENRNKRLKRVHLLRVNVHSIRSRTSFSNFR